MSSVTHNTILAFLILCIAVPEVQSECPPIYIFTAQAPDFGFGYSVASAGDVNHDGYADLLVGSPFSVIDGVQLGRTYVFSGLNGDTLFIFTGAATSDKFGLSVAPAGDVNNDGYEDIIVGAVFNDASFLDAGRAYVFSGLNGDTLHVFSGEADFDRFGESVASAGDFNKDGYADLIVGAPGSDAAGNNTGRAYVFSGKNGVTLSILTDTVVDSRFGGSVASAGDVNNDGFSDVVIGHQWNVSAGRASVFLGPFGESRYVFNKGEVGDQFGNSVASAGDVNGDNYADIIVGARGGASASGAGQSYVFSGLNGDTLFIFNGEFINDHFGTSVATAGDVNNDGYGDLIVGEWEFVTGGTGQGRVYVYSGAPTRCCCIGSTGNADNDPEDQVDIADLTFLIDNLFINFTSLSCTEEGNIDGQAGIDIADLTFLIDHLFINFPVLPDCP